MSAWLRSITIFVPDIPVKAELDDDVVMMTNKNRLNVKIETSKSVRIYIFIMRIYVVRVIVIDRSLHNQQQLQLKLEIIIRLRGHIQKGGMKCLKHFLTNIKQNLDT